MRIRLVFVLAFTVLASTISPLLSQTTSVKGKVVVAAHDVAMKNGTLYHVSVEGADFQPQVVMMPAPLIYLPTNFTKPNLLESYYLASKDENNSIYIVPSPYGLRGKGPFNYTFSVKEMPLAKKPLLEVKGELMANDPPFKVEFGTDRKHCKSNDIKLTAGQVYVIDMTSPPGGMRRLDSYLYLLDSKGKVLRSDDDGGGFPNARIIFPPTETGDYRIISTGLGDALGEFTMTVRTTEKK
jgi:hypothetical protein